MIPDHREVLKVAAELEAAERVVEDLKARWAALFDSATVTRNTPRTVTPSPIRDNALAGRVVKYLNNEPNRTFTAGQIASELHEDTLKVSRVLFRQTNKGRIEKRGYGHYGAKRKLEVAA